MGLTPAQPRPLGLDGRWEVLPFGDIVAIRNEKIMPSAVAADTQCVELESISQGTGQLLRTAGPPGSAKNRFRAGDVLFGRLRAYLRKFWLASFDGVCSTEIWPLIPRGHRVCSEFLHYLVQTTEFVDAACVSYGTHMPRSDWAVLRQFQVLIPPLPEQRAIAAELSDVATRCSTA